MPVRIRLQRHGKKGKPFYWIVAADARSKRDGKYLEKLGTYDPNQQPASIELDCRLLPDQDPEAFLTELEHIINDEQISIETIMGFTPAVSDTSTPLYESIERVLTLHYENMKAVPSVSTGFTDSHFFRDINITSYGFGPFLFEENEKTGVHGNNERISIENMIKGTEIMTDFVMDFAVE